MSSFDIGYCSNREYIRTENDRFREADLTIGGLYTVLFQLTPLSSAPKDARQKAAKYPSRILKKTPLEGDWWDVDFRILNADLAPDCDARASTTDGYLLSVPADKLHIGHTYSVIAGYFRKYSSGHDAEQELQDIIANRAPALDLGVRKAARVCAKVF